MECSKQFTLCLAFEGRGMNLRIVMLIITMVTTMILPISWLTVLMWIIYFNWLSIDIKEFGTVI